MDTIFHVYNRGVEKRKIYIDDCDYKRFIFSLGLFNSQSPTNPNAHRTTPMMEVPLPSLGFTTEENLVEIMAFCLMPNHYHLMIRPKIERGLTMFMRKLGTGYTNYFNLRYKRVGSLFQGIYKQKPVTTDSHFNWLPHYIHCNPFVGSGTSNIYTEYPWSSYGEYAGEAKYPDIVDTSFLSSWFESSENFKRETSEWLNSEKQSSDLHDLAMSE